MIWQMPESRWLIWLWHLVSWILTFYIDGVFHVVSLILFPRFFFCVFIMDYMSRITERMVLGHEAPSPHTSIFGMFLYLIRQEIPRAVIPVLISVAVMIIGLFTPVSLVIITLSSLVAGVFLAWDNTDLVPARRMVPFKARLKISKRKFIFPHRI